MPEFTKKVGLFYYSWSVLSMYL